MNIEIAEIAIHLYAGYITEYVNPDEASSIKDVSSVAKFVPSVLAASQTMDTRLAEGDTSWSKVFAYDVVHAAGVWLAQHDDPTIEDFETKLKELTA